MGKQSTIPTSRRTAVSLALVVLLALAGLAASAQTTPLLLPSAIVFDVQGNLYIADAANHDIRKIDTSGNITTIAGNGTQGFSGDNGPATAAELDSPQGLALDANQNLYIADTHNQRIRKLSLTTGQITTIAGTGAAGYAGDGDPSIAAEFALPTALALDTSQNLYIADTANHRIREINATTGTITTIAGNGTQGFSGDNGPATAAAIDSPTGIAIDAAGNLYLADTHNQRIRRIDATTGIITTIAGTGASAYSGDNAAATGATIALPHGLTLDAQGNLYIADTANHRIREINATTGQITTIAGNGTQAFTGDNGPATAASLDSPRAVTLPSNGLVTLADTGNQRIRQLDSATLPNIHTYAGVGTAIPGTLTITGPSSTFYGTGQLVISLATPASSQPATGTITLADQTTDQTSGATTLGPATLSANTATISIATLSTGTHTLVATYSGDGTYATAQSATFNITIRQAAVNITLTTSGASAAPLTITTQVASTTTGTPTGTITLLDSGNPLDAFTLPASGQTTFSTSTLSTGTHTFTAVYSGDTNFAASTSAPSLVTIGTGSGTTIGGGTGTGTASTPDFSLNTTGTSSQTILSGGSATFNLAFKTTGSTLSSPIALSASGLPSLATASFNPSYLPPGTASQAFTLTIAMPAAISSAAAHQRTRFSPVAFALLLFPVAGLAFQRRNRSRATLFVLALAAFTLTCCSGCGNRIRTGSLDSGPPIPYTITVTGTATTPTSAALQHTATVTLLLQQTN